MEKLEKKPPLWMTGDLIAPNGNRRLMTSESGKAEAWCDDKFMQFIRGFYNKMEVLRYDRQTGVLGLRPCKRADISWKGAAMLANYMLGLNIKAYDNGKVAYNGFPFALPYEKWTFMQLGDKDMALNVDGTVKEISVSGSMRNEQ